MKLDWKRFGSVSVARAGIRTALVTQFGDAPFGKQWGAEVRHADTGIMLFDATHPGHASCDIAEQKCEQWIDSIDRPEWHEATPWLWWAEWRGCRLRINRTHPVPREWYVCVTSVTHNCREGTRLTLDEAKAAAEKWVREQTA